MPPHALLCPSVGSLSWDTVPCENLQCESPPQAADLCELPQRGPLQERTDLSRATGPASSCVVMGSSLHGSAGPARSLLHCRLSVGSQPPSGTHLPRQGLLRGLQVGIYSTVDLYEMRGFNLPHRDLPTRGISILAPGASSSSSPSFRTDPGACRTIYFTYSHPSHWLPLTLCSFWSFFPPFLNVLSQMCCHHC